jgi:DNA-binding IclR family transcriptional regulator
MALLSPARVPPSAEKVFMKPETASKAPTSANTLQTLDRGLHALNLIATRVGGVTVAELAEALDVHRAIAYRLVSTLEAHGLIARMRNGRLVTGAGVLRLSATFADQFRALAQPFLVQLAEASGATAFLTVAQGEECTAIQVCEPQTVDLRMSYRVGSRHPITSGASGIAILSARPPAASDSEAVKQARRLGYSLTQGEVQTGAVGIACPVQLPSARDASSFEASVGVVTLQTLETQHGIRLVMACARQIAEQLTTA